MMREFFYISLWTFWIFFLENFSKSIPDCLNICRKKKQMMANSNDMVIYLILLL